MNDLLTKIIAATEKQGVTLTLETLEAIRDHIEDYVDSYTTESYDKGFDAGYNQGLQSERPRP